jgi:uncharacterized protein (DUF302 family)
MTIEGLATVSSKSGFIDTVRKLEAEIAAHGLTVFARIDHAAGAAQAGLSLRPTLLIIFGNAKAGTPLMQRSQTVGIDLPLKLLVWQDEAGATQISYNRPDWIAERHGIGHVPVLDAMEALLSSLAKAN